MTVVFRPCLSTYVIIDGLVASFLLCTIARAIQGVGGAWPVASVLSIVLVLSHIWVSRHRIVVSEYAVQYRSMFRTESIAFSEISNTVFCVGLEAKMLDRLKGRGFYRIVIQRKGRPLSESLVINAKLFSWNDVQEVCSLLERSRSGDTTPK